MLQSSKRVITEATAEGLHPELQMSIKEQDALFTSWKAELSIVPRALYWFGRVICLNIFVEDLVDGVEESIKRLESVYNLIGLIAALLLSMGIGPFQDFPQWVRVGSFSWGLSPFQVVCQQLSAYALLAMMASCLVNRAYCSAPSLFFSSDSAVPPPTQPRFLQSF